MHVQLMLFVFSRSVKSKPCVSCVFRGQCMEDVWKAGLDSMDEKEKGPSVVCSGRCTAVLPAEQRISFR